MSSKLSEAEVFKKAITARTHAYYQTLGIADYTTLKTIKSSDIELSSCFRFMKFLRFVNTDKKIPPTDTVCFCVNATRGESTSIMGFVYYSHDQLEPIGACVGGSFISQDGEYRKFYIDGAMLEIVPNDDAFRVVWQPVEELIAEKIDSGELEIDVELFCPPDCESQNELKNKFDQDRMAITIICLCWLCDYFAIHNDIEDNHLNPDYVDVIYDPDDSHVYEQIKQNLNNNIRNFLEEVDVITYATLDFKINIDGQNELQHFSKRIGQKVFPLNSSDISNVFSLESAVWREKYIWEKIQTLTLNLITPSFPILTSWFFIQNASARAFDNEQQLIKFHKSEVADQITKNLEITDDLTYDHQEIGPKTHIDRNFAGLSNKIFDALDFAESKIKMSDSALVIFSEYVGRTIRDIIPRPPKDSELSTLVDYRMYENPNIFIGFMFEFCYAAYCANTCVGVMHGDLHVNNVTLFNAVNKTAFSRTSYKMYIIDDAKVKNPAIYVFEHIGIFGMIIDFSRAIIGNTDMLQRDFDDAAVDNCMRDQKTRIMQIIAYHFSDFALKNADALDDLLNKRLPEVFKVLTALDMYTLTRGLDMMAKTEHVVEFDPKIIGLIKGMNDTCRELFLEGMQQLLGGGRYTGGWPNRILIDKYFSSHARDASNLPKNIVDIFAYKSTIPYSATTYETQPPIMRYDDLYEIPEEFGGPSPGGRLEAYFKQMKLGDRNLEKFIEAHKSSRVRDTQQPDWMFS